jgi:succinate-acetate transporter protein
MVSHKAYFFYYHIYILIMWYITVFSLKHSKAINITIFFCYQILCITLGVRSYGLGYRCLSLRSDSFQNYRDYRS